MENHRGELAGQVAVVTGASKGIGAGIAKALAAEGAEVVVNYSSRKEGAERVVQEILSRGGSDCRSGGRLETNGCNATLCQRLRVSGGIL